MSTDFSLDALLNGSPNNVNTSVTSPTNSKQSPTLSVPEQSFTLAGSTPIPAVHFPSISIPTPPTEPEVSAGAKKRCNKRKREEEEDDDVQQKNSAQPEPKKKRVRTAYTRQQLQRLEYMFAQNQYPDMLMRENIAEELGLPDQKIHVWFQNRRAKQRRLRGQPTTPFPSPAVCASIMQCPPTISHVPKTTAAPVYHYQHYPKQAHQSVAVQTRPSPLSIQTHPPPLSMQKHPPPLSVLTPSPSPSPVHFRRSCSSTPSPNVSPTQLQMTPPSGSIVPPPVYHPPYSFMLPTTRTSPTFTPPFPYYHPQRTSSSSQAPMYFLDMTPPLSGNRVNSVFPAFPQFYPSQ